jgi:hypothetical protein
MYKKIDPDNYLNDIEFNLKEFIEQNFDAHYVFDIDNSYKAVASEPYKPVFFFQFGDTNIIRENVITADDYKRADFISFEYVVFLLLNDNFTDNNTKRELNKISNQFLNTFIQKQPKLLEYFESINLSSQGNGNIKSPNGFLVSQHNLNGIIKKER